MVGELGLCPSLRLKSQGSFLTICKLPDHQSSFKRGRTAREFWLQTPDIIFSEWYACDQVAHIPCGKSRGLYIVARFDTAPEQSADPLCADILYIGETHGKNQSISKRLQKFFKAAQTGGGVFKHSGGNRFHKCFQGDLYNIYAAGFAPDLDEPFLTPFIYLVERQLIWDYVVKWGRMPTCNGK